MKLSLPQTPSPLQGILFAVLLGSTTVLYAQQEADAPPLTPVCFGCHGPAGVSTSPAIPSLAGQNETYLLKRLIELKTQETPSQTMKAVTHEISDAELKRLAKFFARQPYLRNAQPVDKEKVARGHDVYIRICNTCHKEEGRATVYPEYPLLAGQSLHYMLNELDHILSRKRAVDVLKIGTLGVVPRNQIEDAIHFFASQEVSPEQIRNNVNEPTRGSKRNRNTN